MPAQLPTRPMALGLLSGGLDSTLAAAVLKGCGLDVAGLYFNTGFCLIDHRRLLHRGTDPRAAAKLRNPALHAGAGLQIPVDIIDISEEYMEVLTRPKYGYGSAYNPCIDCRIMMLDKARGIMEERGAAFVFTGEVIGQRPMTQMRNSLRLIEKQSGLEGRLLRPLSAHLLPETIPEKEGIVPRERLYGFSGRGRKDQVRLARELNVTDYPQPAGGCCFLTDKNYARRIKALVKWRGRITREDVFLLKLGRHFLMGEVHVIVGRDEPENELLLAYTRGRWQIEVREYPAPLALAEGNLDGQALAEVAGLAARFSDGRDHPGVTVHYADPDGRVGSLVVAPASPEEVERFRI